MNSKKVFFKIIVPNYNNMLYIKKCLDSILQQTFKDFFVVVVDDMSTDCSDKFCEAYERIYPDKMKLLRLEKKGYAGAARNKDDWLYDTNVLQKMHDKIVEANMPELLRVGAQIWNVKTSSYMSGEKTLEAAARSGKCAPWWSCIRIKFASIKFAEDRAKCNDVLWFAQLLDAVDQNKVAAVDSPCYVYNECSSTSAQHSKAKYSDACKEAEELCRQDMSEYQAKTKYAQMFKDRILKNGKKTSIEQNKTPAKEIKNIEKKTDMQAKQDKDSCFFKIIIPNYNNMPYIKKCLDSILNQTFQDFKIVVVDDLSTDSSDKFCEVYARKYSDKIKYIQMKSKGHEGGCRNAGIKYKVNCEYYMFIDGDDWLYNDKCLQTLYNNVKNEMPDVLLYCLTQLKNNKYRNAIPPKFDWTSNHLAFKYSSACTKIIRHNKIQYFLENCDHAADTYFSMKIFNQHPTVKQIFDIIYVYNRNNSSVTLNGNYTKDTQLFYKKFIQLLDEITEQNVKRAMLNRIFMYLEHKIDY